MRFLIAFLLVLVFCSRVSAVLIDVPFAFRQENWKSDTGYGSCGWAATITALRCSGQIELARWYRKNYSGFTYATILIRAANRTELRFDYTTTGNRKWMEWALRNRLPVVCTYYDRHVVCVIGSAGNRIIISDNNHIDYYRFVPKNEFYNRWKNEFSAFGMVFLYPPLPPWPK